MSPEVQVAVAAFTLLAVIIAVLIASIPTGRR